MANIKPYTKSDKRILVHALRPGDLVECGGKAMIILARDQSHPILHKVPMIPVACLADATLTFLEPTCPVYLIYRLEATCEERAVAFYLHDEEDVEDEQE